MSHVNRARAQRLMQARGLDAVVLAKPESFTWASGAPAGVAAFFRRAGACLAVVPADPGTPIQVVTTELFAPAARQALGEAHVWTHCDWVETADIRPWVNGSESAAVLVSRAQAQRPAGFARPAVFDARAAFGQLAQLLQRAGLSHARLGLDLDFWPVADYRLLCEVLPGVVWRDASATVSAIKVVKSAGEIERLQTAAAWAEAGMVHAIAAIHPGVDRAEIAQAWQEGVARAVQVSGRRMSGQWEYITVGALPWQGGGRVQVGDVIKFDVGCLVDGYSSDSGRTFVCGQPRQRTQDIAQGLQDAFEAGLEVLKPGQPMSEVHRRATEAMHRAGFGDYQRGHFGHSLGHDTFCEVAPFLAQAAHDLIEPGMVLAFETPFYVDGEGGFIIEDQFVITETGAVPAWGLPRALQVLPQ
jgi:Xaa-Pro aminopeptidase